MATRLKLLGATMALSAFFLTSCNQELDFEPKEKENPDKEMEASTPITITAKYGSGDGTKVSYTQSGNSISAAWDEDDILYVVYNGHVNQLQLTGGNGTASATFSGTISGSPKAASVFSCYVGDVHNAAALAVNESGDLIYSDAAYFEQDGTLASAGRCNTYSGTTNYGNGENLTCYFRVNTSMLKFTVSTLAGVSAGAGGATLTYMSGETELAKATFTVGAGGVNTIYMAVPSGSYTGEQALVYKYGDQQQRVLLSATRAQFETGQTYSKVVHFPLDLSRFTGNYTAKDGDILTGTLSGNRRIAIADKATVRLRDVSITQTGSNPGIVCEGDAQLILEGTSSVRGSNNKPGLQIGGSGTTLTITGDGTLTALPGAWAAAIGVGRAWSGNATGGNIVINGGTIIAQCENSDWSAGIGTGVGHGGTATMGNITINGGTVMAYGGKEAAGIGTSFCYGDGVNHVGNITLNGGTITATGGLNAAGIGTGYSLTTSSQNSVGNITIGAGVTSVTAVKGFNEKTTTVSIGAVFTGTCGTISIANPSKVYRSFPVDLSLLNGDYTAQDGDILTGVLSGNRRIAIADKATVWLRDVTIAHTGSDENAGIVCEGDAELILEGTNSVQGSNNKPGLQIGGSGTTLTITGDGTLTALPGAWAAAIGVGRAWSGNATGGNIVINGGTIIAQCENSDWSAGIGTGVGHGGTATMGNITINGGTVMAYGGKEAAGIGTSFCYGDGVNHVGNITLNGGTITATGGLNAAGIGTGYSLTTSSQNSVGNITIGAGVTSVTAVKGFNEKTTTVSIGAVFTGTCGTISIANPMKVYHGFPVDLSLLTGDYTAKDGDILTGSLSGNRRIAIANKATVWLRDVTIAHAGSDENAGIVCEGDADLILEGTNTVQGSNNKPGLQIGGSGTTLTITGDGTLTALPGAWAAAIGISCAWYGNATGGNIVINGGTIIAQCENSDWSAGIGTGVGHGGTATMGNITINGGTVMAYGGKEAAGIGTSFCYGDGVNHVGNITLNGGAITATGGLNAAGIGTGYSLSNSSQNSVGNITIGAGVTSVTAIKGFNEKTTTVSIGAVFTGTCGTISIANPSKVTQN